MRVAVTMNEICNHCNEPVKIRNPSGYCDHLYFPENCKTCNSGERMEVDWSKSHNGVYRTPFLAVQNIMPEVQPILEDPLLFAKLQYPKERYIVDVKTHMLMPNQFAAIPNWHFDMIPRDKNNQQDFSKASSDKMYLWVSGEPLTEFRRCFIPTEHKIFAKKKSDPNCDCEPVKVMPKVWKEFTQYDSHRGTMSDKFTWRCFIRLVPDTIMKAAPSEKWLRRHSQVYLDSSKFTW